MLFHMSKITTAASLLVVAAAINLKTDTTEASPSDNEGSEGVVIEKDGQQPSVVSGDSKVASPRAGIEDAILRAEGDDRDQEVWEGDRGSSPTTEEGEFLKQDSTAVAGADVSAEQAAGWGVRGALGRLVFGGGRAAEADSVSTMSDTESSGPAAAPNPPASAGRSAEDDRTEPPKRTLSSFQRELLPRDGESSPSSTSGSVEVMNPWPGKKGSSEMSMDSRESPSDSDSQNGEDGVDTPVPATIRLFDSSGAAVEKSAQQQESRIAEAFVLEQRALTDALDKVLTDQERARNARDENGDEIVGDPAVEEFELDTEDAPRRMLDRLTQGDWKAVAWARAAGGFMKNLVLTRRNLQLVADADSAPGSTPEGEGEEFEDEGDEVDDDENDESIDEEHPTKKQEPTNKKKYPLTIYKEKAASHLINLKAKYLTAEVQAYMKHFAKFAALFFVTITLFRSIMASMPILKYVQSNIDVTFGAQHYPGDHLVGKTHPLSDTFMQVGISEGCNTPGYAQLFVYDKMGDDALTNYFSIGFGEKKDEQGLVEINGQVGKDNQVFRSVDWDRKRETSSTPLLQITRKERDGIVDHAQKLARKVNKGGIKFDPLAPCIRDVKLEKPQTWLRMFQPRVCDSGSFMQHLFKLSLPKHAITYKQNPETAALSDFTVTSPEPKNKDARPNNVFGRVQSRLKALRNPEVRDALKFLVSKSPSPTPTEPRV